MSVNHFLSSEDWKQESSDDRPAASTTHLKLKQSSAAQTADTTLTCSTEARRPSSRVHPVPLHPLHQAHRRHGHFVVLLPKFQHLGETGDVQARVCRQRSVCDYRGACSDSVVPLKSGAFVPFGSLSQRRFCLQNRLMWKVGPWTREVNGSGCWTENILVDSFTLTDVENLIFSSLDFLSFAEQRQRSSSWFLNVLFWFFNVLIATKYVTQNNLALSFLADCHFL